MGLSDLAAEEVVCRQHELYVLRASGSPPWRCGGRVLEVLDGLLAQIHCDLGARPRETLTPAQQKLLRSAQLTRFLLTSRVAHMLHLLLGFAAASVAAAQGARWLAVT